MNRRDFIKVGLGVAATAYMPKNAHGQLCEVTPRFPATVVTDWLQDASAALRDGASNAYIEWHATHAQSNYLGVDTWGNQYNDRNLVQEWGAMHRVLINDNVPFVSVHVIKDTGNSDGLGQDPNFPDWSRNYYRIPAALTNTAHLIQQGFPGNIDDRTEDRHMFLYNSQDNTMDEFYQVWYNAAGVDPWGTQGFWEANIACRYDVSSVQASRSRTPVHPPETLKRGADMTGLVMAPGRGFFAELYNSDCMGDLNHAVPFINYLIGSVGGKGAWCYPAGSTQTVKLDDNAVPAGARLRLRPQTDDWGNPPFDENLAFPDSLDPVHCPAFRRLCRCLRTYGMILTDASGSRDLGISMYWDNRYNVPGGYPQDCPAQRWVNAFRFYWFGPNAIQGPPWRSTQSGRFYHTNNPLTQFPTWEDFEVVQLGYPGPRVIYHY